MRDVAFRKTFFSDTRMEAGIMGREAQLRKTGGGRKGVSAEGNGGISAQRGVHGGLPEGAYRRGKTLRRNLSGNFGGRGTPAAFMRQQRRLSGTAQGQSCVGKKRRASENRARERASRRPVSGLVRQKRPGHARYRRSSCMEKGPGKAGNRNASGERKPDSGVSGGASPFRMRCGRRGRSSGCFPETAGRVAEPERRCARCGSAGWADLPEGKSRGKGRCPVHAAR